MKNKTTWVVFVVMIAVTLNVAGTATTLPEETCDGYCTDQAYAGGVCYQGNCPPGTTWVNPDNGNKLCHNGPNTNSQSDNNAGKCCCTAQPTTTTTTLPDTTTTVPDTTTTSTTTSTTTTIPETCAEYCTNLDQTYIGGECTQNKPDCDDKGSQWVWENQGNKYCNVADSSAGTCCCEKATECSEGDAPPLAQNQFGVCEGSTMVCMDGEWTQPDYTLIPGYEAIESTCDGLDNNCDDTTDEMGAANCQACGECERAVCADGSCGCEPLPENTPCGSYSCDDTCEAPYYRVYGLDDGGFCDGQGLCVNTCDLEGQFSLTCDKTCGAECIGDSDCPEKTCDGNSLVTSGCDGDTCSCKTVDTTSCDDGKVCTTDDCVSGGCVNDPILDCCTKDKDCEDGMVCVENECKPEMTCAEYCTTLGAGYLDGNCRQTKDDCLSDEVWENGGNKYCNVADSSAGTCCCQKEPDTTTTTSTTTTTTLPCVPQCDGMDCGEDGCGGTCGECQSDEVCNSDFQCETTTTTSSTTTSTTTTLPETCNTHCLDLGYLSGICHTGTCPDGMTSPTGDDNGNYLCNNGPTLNTLILAGRCCCELETTTTTEPPTTSTTVPETTTTTSSTTTTSTTSTTIPHVTTSTTTTTIPETTTTLDLGGGGGGGPDYWVSNREYRINIIDRFPTETTLPMSTTTTIEVPTTLPAPPTSTIKQIQSTTTLMTQEMAQTQSPESEIPLPEETTTLPQTSPLTGFATGLSGGALSLCIPLAIGPPLAILLAALLLSKLKVRDLRKAHAKALEDKVGQVMVGKYDFPVSHAEEILAYVEANGIGDSEPLDKAIDAFTKAKG